MTAASREAPRPRPFLWAGLFIANMAVIALLQRTGALERPVPFILLVLNLLLIVPMVRAAKSVQERRGAMSPALRVYNRRVLIAMAGYMAAMIGGGMIHNRIDPASPLVWLLAIAPLIPLLAFIRAIVRYYREEEDEFLRHRAVTGALIGLVLVLTVGTLWGFLEMYGLVPRMWSWWVFPVWAVGLGIGTWRGGTAAGEEA